MDNLYDLAKLFEDAPAEVKELIWSILKEPELLASLLQGHFDKFQ